VALRTAVCSELAVPLQTDEGVIGVINVDSDRPDAFTADTATVLEMLARRCVDAVAYARLYSESRRRSDELAALVEVGRDLSSTLDLREVLSRAVRHARRLLGGKLASLLLEEGGRFRTVAADGASAAYLAREPPDLESVAGRVFRTGQPLWVDDVREDSRFRLSELAEAEGLAGLLSVPVRSKDRILGVLNVYSAEARCHRPADVSVATLLAQQSAVAIENARLFEQEHDARLRLRESEKLAALGRLSAGLAHELRNPLNTLSILTYAMAEACREPRATADLEVIRAEIRRMGRLLEQFLDFARPTAPRFRRVPVDDVLDATLLLLSPEAGKSAVTIDRSPGRDAPRVWADADQLKQAFLNLALNALQAMPGGGALRVATSRAPGGIVVEIRDTGPGISPDIRERLFEPFATTREGGTGLGLPIALRIVEAHSGELRIASAPGEGTTAAVWLPE
jgi:signal transduction histidine kinase